MKKKARLWPGFSHPSCRNTTRETLLLKTQRFELQRRPTSGIGPDSPRLTRGLTKTIVLDYGVTLCTKTSPVPTRTLPLVLTSTVPRSTRPAAGAAFAVTLPGTVQEAPAGRNALASVTETEPNAGFAKTSR